MSDSKILDALKEDDESPFWISNDERIMLTEMLASVSVVLRNGSLWFNKKGDPVNQQYADLADCIARRFANMPVEGEN
jgi:hypothetical protein